MIFNMFGGNSGTKVQRKEGTCSVNSNTNITCGFVPDIVIFWQTNTTYLHHYTIALNEKTNPTTYNNVEYDSYIQVDFQDYSQDFYLTNVYVRKLENGFNFYATNSSYSSFSPVGYLAIKYT